MSTTNAGNLKKGQYINLNGEIFQVLKTDHNYRGRGSAYMKVKVKNLRTENTVDMNFRSNDSIELEPVDAVKLSYLYKDLNSLYFMDEKTYEQNSVPQKMAGAVANYLKEGDQVFILMSEGVPIGIRPPQSVRLKITEAHDATRGNTTMTAKKTVTLETGVNILVPLFIKKGDTIVVNCETGEYVERGS